LFCPLNDIIQPAKRTNPIDWSRPIMESKMADHVPSNITAETLVKSGAIDKGTIERAFERIRRSRDKAEFHAVVAAQGVRQVGESGVIGALLGAIHAKSKTGLDMKLSAPVGTLTAPSVPLDGAVMAAGFIAGVFLADEPSGVGKTAMNAAAASAAVFTFRQTNDLFTKMAIKASGITPGGGAALPNASAAASQPGVISKANFAGETMGYGAGFHHMSRIHGMHGEDPIVAAARRLG
jgi:hypothetical protein